MSGRSVQARVADLADSLSAAQRKVADLVVRDPEAVAFGTVQSVAEQADTSTPTVVRFATTLGFEGFGELRDAVRAEVSERLRSAAARIDRTRQGPLLEHALAVERANVERTFADLDPDALDRAIDLLADVDRRVWVLPSTQLGGVGSHLVDDLSLCRGRVVLLAGGEFRVTTMLAGLRSGDVLVTLDIQRHEAWLVRAQQAAVARGAVPLALTDRLPCSLDLTGGLALTFACETANVFESQVGVLCVANVLVTGVVDRRRPAIAERVAALEELWVAEGLFD